MSISELSQIASRHRYLLDLAPTGVLIGRMLAGVGPCHFVSPDDLRQFWEDWPNALKDLDEEALLDVDGRPLYEPGAIMDNPIAATQSFDTVADMLAWERPWRLNETVTLNWAGTDELRLKWVMVASPDLADNGDSILADDLGYGFFVRIAQA